MTPIWDMSDIVANPTRTNGLSFFYTGSAQPNDGMKVYAFDQQGNWDELANIAGTVGATLSNWQDDFEQSYGPYNTINSSGYVVAFPFKFTI